MKTKSETQKNTKSEMIDLLAKQYYYEDSKKAFEIYWKARQYRHPEETKKEKHKALIFFKEGWNKGLWLTRLRIEKNE
jgi:hypothetical protein